MMARPLAPDTPSQPTHRRTVSAVTMKSVDLPHLRSVVLAGHAGAGKTTLAEQLLFKAGAIPRLGKVDDGTFHAERDSLITKCPSKYATEAEQDPQHVIISQ